MAYQKVEQFFKSSWYWRIPIIAAFLTVVLMIDEINQSLFLVLNSALYIPVESIWLNVSIFSEADVIAIMLLPLLARRPNLIWAALFSCTITIISVELAKQYFALPRPSVILDYGRFHQSGEIYTVDSFPSVNVAVAFSIAAIIILSVQQLWLKVTIFLYACLMALSQIAIGANWPIDIFSGVIAGWLPATVGFDFAKKKIFKTKFSIKILLVLLMIIAAYFIYDMITGDIAVAALKIIILIVCFIMSIPDVRKIVKYKFNKKQFVKSRKNNSK